MPVPSRCGALWSRRTATQIALPTLRGRSLEQVYPVTLPEWTIRMVHGAPTVEAYAGPSARIFAVR